MTSESPFAPVCSRQSFLETPAGGEVLKRLDDGLGTREPFLLITGGPGTGKTTLVREAVARWGARVTAAFLAYPALTGAEFLEEIVRRFGADPVDGASRSKLVACIERALAENTSRGQVALLVIDDAHALSLELLEELRLLVNAAQQVGRPLEILLIGLPTLEARFSEPALATLRQRVSVHARLEPLSPAEVRRYIHHRVTAVGGDGPTLFSRKTCRDIAARTRGVSRQINALAAEALRVAQSLGHQTVGVEHVQTAATSLGGFAQTAYAEGLDDVDSKDSPSLSGQAPAVAPAKIEAIAPAKAEVIAPVRPAVVAPVKIEVIAPASAAGEDAPLHTPPGKHDPGEWVARFVGEHGPLQIGSRAVSESTRESASYGANDFVEPATPADPPPPAPKRRHPAPPRSHSKNRALPRMAITASLITIVLVGAVALIVRVSGLARSHAGQSAAVTSSAPATPSADKASPSEHGAAATASRASSHGEAGAPPPSVNEGRSDEPSTVSRGPFTLDVGGYREFERALTERDRMHRLTGFEGWVISAADGEDRPYRVVLGMYRSRERANAAADMLINSKTLPSVIVVPLPPKRARR